MESDTTQTSHPAETFDVYKWMAWVHANRKALITGAVVAALIGSAIGIYSWKKGQDELHANDQFFALPAVYGSAEKAVHPTVAQLTEVAKAYPDTSIGEQAELLAAETLFTQGDFKKSEEAFAAFLAKHPASEFAAQASVGEAASIEASGDIAKATQKYQQIVTKYRNEAVTDPVKLTLARLFEEQGKKDPAKLKEAVNYYEELTRGATYGNPWASEAMEREAALLSAHPELKPAPAVNLTPAPAPAPAPAKSPTTTATPAAKPNTAATTNAPVKTK